MKKSKKIMLRIVPVLMVLMVVVLSGNVFGADVKAAATNPISTNLSTGSESIGTLDSTVKKVWNSVALILQVLAIAAVVFAGVKYMFASADSKADIKKGMGALAIGAILVFGATTVINFIVTLTTQATTATTDAATKNP
jgi:type IV secretory pathway VirB2 component (pilin)